MVTAPTSNEEAVSALLASLRQEGVVDTHDEALGRLALTLAETLDDGAGMAVAAVARELRAVLTELTTREVTIDEQDPIFGADLSAPLRDTPES
jgi:hypothetical protein